MTQSEKNMELDYASSRQPGEGFFVPLPRVGDMAFVETPYIFARLFGFFFCMLCIVALPFIVAFTSGVASAGITAGLQVPIEQKPWMYVLFGVAAVMLGRRGMVILPITCLCMTTLGQLHAAGGAYAMLDTVAYGALIIFAAAATMARSVLVVIGMAAVGGFSYFTGAGFLPQAPELGYNLYFLLGNLSAIALMLLSAMSFTFTLTWRNQWLHTKARALPVISLFF